MRRSNRSTNDARALRVGTMVAVPLLVAVLTLAACSSSTTGNASGSATTQGSVASSAKSAPTVSTIARPAGPAANLSQEITGGNGVFLGESSPPSFDKSGYVQKEYVASGTATSYTAPAGLPTDGHFELQPATSADYKTRIVVRRPPSADKFNGTVMVEWLNVSGGVDADPDYTYVADEVQRGYVWVGVSAQAIGVEGGPVAVSVGGQAGDVAGKGLKKIDPARYGTLSLPGDAYSYDIFTQVARGLRGDEGKTALNNLTPQRILGVGESQSAFTLTTYVDGVQPLTHAYDGFLLHSRGGAPAPLGDGSKAVDIASAISGKPTIVRDDTTVPVLIVETETDVTSIIGYYPARQPDTDKIRVWEIAGTAHADKFQVGPFAEQMDCGAPINDGPQRFILRTALRDLDTWVKEGKAPPKATPLQTDLVDGKPVIKRDADGVALGGIRTAPVDAPVAALTGDPGSANPTVICLLLGSTKPFTAARLAELYPSRQAYLDAFAKANDASIAAGFVLADDRQAVLDTATPNALPA